MLGPREDLDRGGSPVAAVEALRLQEAAVPPRHHSPALGEGSGGDVELRRAPLALGALARLAALQPEAGAEELSVLPEEARVDLAARRTGLKPRHHPRSVPRQGQGRFEQARGAVGVDRPIGPAAIPLGVEELQVEPQIGVAGVAPEHPEAPSGSAGGGEHRLEATTDLVEVDAGVLEQDVGGLRREGGLDELAPPILPATGSR